MFAGDLGFRVFKLASSKSGRGSQTARTSPKPSKLPSSISKPTAPNRTSYSSCCCSNSVSTSACPLKPGMSKQERRKARSNPFDRRRLAARLPLARHPADRRGAAGPRPRGLAPDVKAGRRSFVVFRDSAFADDVAKSNLLPSFSSTASKR